ncbi:MAG: outer membrane protein assembly factor BamD [Gemmatimonadaceae bacterium]
MHARTWTYVAIAAAAALTACRTGFRVARFPTNEALFAAGVREYEREHWGNAIVAFEKLTGDLPARDTLLPRSYWYLALSHDRQREHLLAAQSFTRLFESFPDDTLADDAALLAGRQYKRLWRKPALDPTYGETALTAYNALLGLYPDSEHAEAARREIAELEQWFATKDYESGMYYYRRKAWDSALIYFRSVLARWPNVPRARDALLRMAEANQRIRYREDYVEACTRLRQSYPGDGEVDRVCRGVPATPLPTDSTARARPIPGR